MDRTPIVRQTAYGLQAFALVPEAAPRPRSTALSHTAGFFVTIGVHIFIFGAVYFMHLADTDLINRRAKEEPVNAIEAGPPVKQKAGAKKAPPPSKEKGEEGKPPDAPPGATNAAAAPQEEKKKPRRPARG